MNKPDYITDLISENKKRPTPFDKIKTKSQGEERAKIAPFIIETKLCEGDVDSNRLLGGDSHAGICWADLLQKGMKRMDRNHSRLQDNPSYYISRERKNYMCFTEIQGNFYICSGWHRSVLNKYFTYYNNLPMIIKNVAIDRVIVDEDFLALYHKLKIFLESRYKELEVYADKICFTEGKKTQAQACIIVALPISKPEERFTKGLKGIVINKNNETLIRQEDGEINIHPEISLILEKLIQNKFKNNSHVIPMISGFYDPYDKNPYSFYSTTQMILSPPALDDFVNDWPSFHYPTPRSVERSFLKKTFGKHGV